MSEEALQKLGLKTKKKSMEIQGIGGSNVQSNKNVHLQLISRHSSFATMLEFVIIEKSSVYNVPEDIKDVKGWSIPTGIKLADKNFNRSGKLDLTIGSELFITLLTNGVIELGPNMPKLQNTLFGWVIMGKSSGKASKGPAFSGMVLHSIKQPQYCPKFSGKALNKAAFSNMGLHFTKQHHVDTLDYVTQDGLRCEINRLQTFKNWPHPFINHSKLARIGFYFKGPEQDNVKCYFCGLEIKGWAKYDDEMNEHMRWNQFCPLLTRQKTNNIPIDVDELNSILPPAPDSIGPCGVNIREATNHLEVNHHSRLLKSCPSMIKSSHRNMEQKHNSSKYNMAPFDQQASPSVPKLEMAFNMVELFFSGPIMTTHLTSGAILRTFAGVVTCQITREVHFEPIYDLSIDGLKAWLKHFISKKGRPSRITHLYDKTIIESCELMCFNNMLTVQRYQDVIINFCKKLSIRWCIIIQHHSSSAPWKLALQAACNQLPKVFGQSIISIQELPIALDEISSIVNSRPNALTIVRSNVQGPIENNKQFVKQKFECWLKVRAVKYEFWKLWVYDYFHKLKSTHKWSTKPGSLVIMKEEIPSFLNWTTARVLDITKHSNWAKQIATVSTASGTVDKYLKELYPVADAEYVSKNVFVGQPTILNTYQPLIHTMNSSASENNASGCTASKVQKTANGSQILPLSITNSSQLNTLILENEPIIMKFFKNKTSGTYECQIIQKAQHPYNRNGLALPNKNLCVCAENHPLRTCPRFLDMTSHERYDEIKQLGLCILCFRPGHKARRCASQSCIECSKAHNTLLHFGVPNSTVGSTIKNRESHREFFPRSSGSTAWFLAILAFMASILGVIGSSNINCLVSNHDRVHHDNLSFCSSHQDFKEIQRNKNSFSPITMQFVKSGTCQLASNEHNHDFSLKMEKEGPAVPENLSVSSSRWLENTTFLYALGITFLITLFGKQHSASARILFQRQDLCKVCHTSDENFIRLLDCYCTMCYDCACHFGFTVMQCPLCGDDETSGIDTTPVDFRGQQLP